MNPVEYPALSPRPVNEPDMASPRPVYVPPGVRPFESWTEIERDYPGHLDVLRFQALPEDLRAGAWLNRRRHAPYDELIPRDLGLDAIHWRMPEERNYGHRLSQLQVPSSLRGVTENTEVVVSMNMVCFDWPLVPHHWPSLPASSANSPGAFSERGDLPCMAGGPARDSAWRLRAGSIRGGTGDPGRLVKEIMKEQRDLSRHIRDDGRTYHEFVPFQMVEYYSQTYAARAKWYPTRPRWWTLMWVSQRLFVPLPPVLTYRGRSLLSATASLRERKYFEAVLEAEWTVLIFGRWCADIPQRGLMWHLPERVNQNLQVLGLSAVLRGSSYAEVDVRRWIWDHDRHPWLERPQTYHWTFGGGGAEPLTAEIAEFVRLYQSVPTRPLDLYDDEEVVASGQLPVRPPTPRAPIPRSVSMPSPHAPPIDPYPPARDSNLVWANPYIDPYADPYATTVYNPVSRSAPASPNLTRLLQENQLVGSIQRYTAQYLAGTGQAQRTTLEEADVVRYLVAVKRQTRDIYEQLQHSEERRERAEVRASALEDAVVVGRGRKRPRTDDQCDADPRRGLDLG